MTMKHYTLFFIIIAVTTIFSFSCEEMILGPDGPKSPVPVKHYSELATLLDSLRYTLDVPAIAAAIVSDTGIIDAQAVGSRVYGGPMNVTINDKFHLGSCGKAFTAVLMGVLVDEGLVNWNTTLPEIFPEYATTMRTEYKSVTIKDLLSQSSGFMRSIDFSILKESSPRARRIEALKWALNQPPAQERGKYLYSNLGYLIAGAITERLTNQDYETQLMEHVIKPLRIASAGFGPMGTEGKEDQPLQHTPNHAPIIATPDAGLDPSYNPAGGLYMTVGDWGKYIQWVLTVEAGHHQNLLKDETARTLTAPAVSTGNNTFYAFGWGGGTYETWAGGKTLSHSGSNGYNYTVAYLLIAKHFGVITMTNQGAVGDDWLLGPATIRLINFKLNGK
jgi:CubicO group peptidase (beta-lactamase class C family)